LRTDDRYIIYIFCSYDAGRQSRVQYRLLGVWDSAGTGRAFIMVVYIDTQHYGVYTVYLTAINAAQYNRAASDAGL